MVVKTSKLFKISLRKLANCRYCQRQIWENILNRKFDMLSFTRTLGFRKRRITQYLQIQVQGNECNYLQYKSATKKLLRWEWDTTQARDGMNLLHICVYKEDRLYAWVWCGRSTLAAGKCRGGWRPAQISP